MPKKHNKIRQVIRAKAVINPSNPSRQPWKEVFADPILRLMLGIIVIWPMLMLLGNFWLAHRWHYESNYVQVSAIEQVGDDNKITFEYSGRIIPAVTLPISETENIAVGDWVVVWTKVSGTNKEVAVSVEGI